MIFKSPSTKITAAGLPGLPEHVVLTPPLTVNVPESGLILNLPLASGIFEEVLVKVQELDPDKAS